METIQMELWQQITENPSEAYNLLEKTHHRFLRDTKINLSLVWKYEHLTESTKILIGLAVAINEKHISAQNYFKDVGVNMGISESEIAEVYACVALLQTNNIFYRFRHFTQKNYYLETPASIKMSIMMQPVLGKVLFELLSLIVSALNGCEMCVNAHEASLVQLGTGQQKIYDAIRLASVLKGSLPLMD